MKLRAWNYKLSLPLALFCQQSTRESLLLPFAPPNTPICHDPRLFSYLTIPVELTNNQQSGLILRTSTTRAAPVQCAKIACIFRFIDFCLQRAINIPLWTHSLFIFPPCLPLVMTTVSRPKSLNPFNFGLLLSSLIFPQNGVLALASLIVNVPLTSFHVVL